MTVNVGQQQLGDSLLGMTMDYLDEASLCVCLWEPLRLG